MSGQDDEDKQYEPSQKKLDDARQKGEIARSQDLVGAAAIGGFSLALAALGGWSFERIGAAMTGILRDLVPLSRTLDGDGGTGAIRAAVVEAILPQAPIFAIAAGAVLVTLATLQGFTFAPSKLEMKLDRISPLSNARNKYGVSGLFEFAKSFLKLAIFSTVLTLFLFSRIGDFAVMPQVEPGQSILRLLAIGLQFLAAVTAISLAIGGVDFLFQVQQHQKRNRMSRQELVDEFKQNEGDPHVKQQRRQKGREIATNRMLADVPSADVVIVNPEHYAVALKWSRTRGTAPSCVAKGVDEIAARIRECAIENGVPIHRDPPTARALFAVVEIGQEIRPEHYRAVAAAIRFAEGIRHLARRRGRA